jgi:hypothetical protein
MEIKELIAGGWELDSIQGKYYQQDLYIIICLNLKLNYTLTKPIYRAVPNKAPSDQFVVLLKVPKRIEGLDKVGDKSW